MNIFLLLVHQSQNKVIITLYLEMLLITEGLYEVH